MYSRPVARRGCGVLLLSERGQVQHWGSKSWQCSVCVTVGTVTGRPSFSEETDDSAAVISFVVAVVVLVCTARLAA